MQGTKSAAHEVQGDTSGCLNNLMCQPVLILFSDHLQSCRQGALPGDRRQGLQRDGGPDALPGVQVSEQGIVLCSMWRTHLSLIIKRD